jgi:hypothetical protein
MPKPYRVEPQRQSGAQSYSAVFRNASGKRVHRGLKTADLSQSQLICAGLARLWTQHIESILDVPFDVPLDAIRLYFGERGTNPDEPVPANAESVDLALGQARAQVGYFPRNVQSRLLPVFLEDARIRRENETLRLELASRQRDLESERIARKQLESSVLVKTMQSAAQAPELTEALALFEAHVKSKCSPKHVKDMLGHAREFAGSLPPSVKISAVTADQVARFIDEAVQSGDRLATRYAFWRTRIGALLNWAAQRWGFVSPMLGVKSVPRHALDRERGDILWHDLNDVEAAVAALPNGYWKALVATLAYAGLQLAELCWLRRTDVEYFSDGALERGRMWVTTVEDPTEEGVRHTLKTGNRRRGIDLHPRLLLPRLKTHMATLSPENVFLFPIPETQRRRKRIQTRGSDERWLVNSLSTVLRGHRGARTRAATPGLLPKGMNAKSLRRTFGSLLLRSGKSTPEVAAAMGNTEEIVRRHYARLVGAEVGVNF